MRGRGEGERGGRGREEGGGEVKERREGERCGREVWVIDSAHLALASIALCSKSSKVLMYS